jgi:hypothetical protein
MAPSGLGVQGVDRLGSVKVCGRKIITRKQDERPSHPVTLWTSALPSRGMEAVHADQRVRVDRSLPNRAGVVAAL